MPPEIIHQDGGAHRILDGEAEIQAGDFVPLENAAGCHGECFDFLLKNLSCGLPMAVSFMVHV